MKLFVICPDCGKKAGINSMWKNLFNEEYDSFKKTLEKDTTEMYNKELTEIIKKIDKLTNDSIELEKQIDQHLLLKLKSINQELFFQKNRFDYIAKREQ